MPSHRQDIMPSDMSLASEENNANESTEPQSDLTSSYCALGTTSALQSTISRKRKQSASPINEEWSGNADIFVLSNDYVQTRRSKKPWFLEGVRLPGLIYPASIYKVDDKLNDTPPQSERETLRQALVSTSRTHENNHGLFWQADLKTRVRSQASIDADDFFMLEDFSIYRPHSARQAHTRGGLEEKVLANELVSLHDVNGRSSSSWLLDGFICYGETRHYVEKVPCSNLSIGGFEDTTRHTVGSAIWVQSDSAKDLNVWYCLGNPSTQYERFHKPFLWLADLAKHLVDYLHTHQQVQLIHFREDFQRWLLNVHGTDHTFQRWLSIYNDTDFRRVIAAHAIFLLNQAWQLDRAYTLHPWWDEIDPIFMQAVPTQTEEVKSDKSETPTMRSKTVVTPFVYDCFKHLPWAKFLDVQQLSSSLRQKHSRAQCSPKAVFRPMAMAATMEMAASDTTSTIRVGDVVGIRSDAQTQWKSNDALWYGYVQEITMRQKGTKLNMIWLYDSTHTPCQDMKYPYATELFLTDHCNCGDTSIYAHEVISRPRVAFFGVPSTPNADFFVRQKYVGADSAWVTLTQSDFRCACKTPKEDRSIEAGTTVLVRSASSDLLEPVEIVGLSPASARRVRVRRLRHRTHYGDYAAAPNELVYTSSIDEIAASNISRVCHVRFYSEEEKSHGSIPVPYCRNGTADFFYITSQEDPENTADLVPLTRPWPISMKQGFDPTVPTPRPALRGLDIFCGGGTFGRGLEEGGAVKMEWAVDYFKQAIHTYRANVDDPDDIRLFYGSVNDYLSQAMKGSNRGLVAQFGEVGVILAGSPCQGFSLANLFKMTDRSLINVSMVASVVSFVDFYRPKYALLENVPNMAKCGTKDKDKNVFAQVLCALVAMGYQVRPCLLDAWSFGSPQSRTRLFVTITAPGLTPLPDPPQSHSHPVTTNNRSLGETANGLPLGERYWGPTPFEYVTIRQATSDLPLNEDGKVDTIQFPDHRITRAVNSFNQTRISQIPKGPPGKSFVEAVNMGWMPRPQREAWNWDHAFRSSIKSKAWRRVLPDALLPTVTTACCPEDSISGQWLHWEADRPMTIMEARRAQGFPDHEVILGTPLIQWKIVGNSVARPVALALGIALRTAWLANEKIEAKALAERFAEGMEIARKVAMMPYQQEETEAVFQQNSLSLRKIMTGVLIERPASSATIEDPVVVSSDSDSDEPAVFTSGPSKSTTRETTTSDVVTPRNDNIIVEIQVDPKDRHQWTEVED